MFDEANGHIKLLDLQTLLIKLKQAYDDPNRVRTVNREIRQLCQKNNSFAFYLADFQRIMADISWNEPSQKA